MDSPSDHRHDAGAADNQADGGQSVDAQTSGVRPESDGLIVWQRRLTVIFLFLLSSFLIFQICAYFADILRILAISLLLSYLVINIVDFLERFIRSRAAAILIVYTALVVVTVVGLVIVIPAMVYQVAQLVQNTFDRLPDLYASLTQALGPLEARLRQAQINVKTVDIIATIAASTPKPEPGIIINRVSDMAMSTMTWVLYAISILVVCFYFLLEGHHISDQLVRLFPRKYRTALHLVAADMDKNLQAFFRGQVVLAVLAGIVMLGVYIALGVNYALLLSAFLAFWEIIPVIGPPIGFAPALLVVAIHGMSFPANRIVQLVILLAAFQLMQQVKDNVIAPRYIGNVIGLHPILIFIAIMIGARMDGMLGIIVALPAACVINVLIGHLPLKETNAKMLEATSLASELGSHPSAKAPEAETQSP